MSMANPPKPAEVPTSSNNGPILHIREDSNKSIDEMFAIVNRPPAVRGHLQVPLRMRKLPQSFFNPPSTHSRENSIDNSGHNNQPGNVHVRTHSSPANLQQSFSLTATSISVDPPQAQHARQTSTIDEKLGPLPQGWEMAKDHNGQVYFMNHVTKTTQWEDPRRQAFMQQQQQMQIRQQQQQAQPQLPPSVMAPRGGPSPQPQPIHQRSASAASVFGAANASANLGPLPEGWEESVSADGNTYYINHITKSTTWIDPRLTAAQQRAPNANPNGFPTPQKTQQEAWLQKLDDERKALQLRQVELRRQMDQTQEMLMRQSLGDNNQVAATAAQQQLAQEQHKRQESADSGVGSMGSNLNLMHIQKDVDMDTSSAMDTTLTDENVNNCANSAAPDATAPNGLMPNLPSEMGEALTSNNIIDSVLSMNQEASWL